MSCYVPIVKLWGLMFHNACTLGCKFDMRIIPKEKARKNYLLENCIPCGSMGRVRMLIALAGVLHFSKNIQHT